MWPFSKPSSDDGSQVQASPSGPDGQQDAPETPPPPVGSTPPATLAAQAAEGRRAAAWRLFHWIAEGNREAIEAVRNVSDGRLLTCFLEWLALGTWAGKSFNVPKAMRQPHFRTQVLTLFLPGPGPAEELLLRVLLDGLRDRRPAVRAVAAHLLGLLDTPDAGPGLIAALRDENPEVRLQAAKALGGLHLVGACPALVAALQAHDEALAGQVRQALFQIGPPAVPAVLEAAHSPDPWVRWHALRALGDLRDARCISALVEALADSDHAVAWMAARALAPLGSRVVRPVLELLIRAPGTPWLMETAGYVLRQQRHPSRLAAILQPVIHSMHDVEYRITAPMAAEHALEELESNRSAC
ncbi:MAG TPA: HEAT repeat domain-containing protein [Ktedonobacterales bacterium]|nr:HEAT repeat domain-containing protein [Ktedonobacterales bacterium]